MSGPNTTTLTHRFPLMSQQPTEFPAAANGWWTSRFPISRTMTGLVFELDAGAIRTLHWHPNASSGSTSSAVSTA